MIGPDPGPGGRHLVRVLSALLREDVVGLRTRSLREDRPDGGWLRLDHPRGALLLPVEPDGFQCELGARLPLVRREDAGGRTTTDLTTAEAVLAALGELADPADRPGFAAFAEECRQSLATERLHRDTGGALLARLADAYGPDPARWTDPLPFDALAARLDHPVYPTGRVRNGLTPHQLRSYAPEFHPTFRLRWLALPRSEVRDEGLSTTGDWPVPSALGLPPSLDDDHLLLPVHPLTAQGPLDGALAETGLHGRAVLAPRSYAEVSPTLSLRTVALAADPRTHLKVPLATASLGRLNRRTIKPGTLRDGAACGRLLAAVIDREPRFRGTVLQADETRYAHADHELLAVLRRRWPEGLDGSVVVSMASLTAPAPGGGLVVDRLADRFHGGDPVALLDAMLTLLFDWQTTLFGYGVALESHQQNVSLVLDDRPDRPPLRLLFKDNDGPRIHAGRLRSALGGRADGLLRDFHDPRITGDDDRPVLDLFATITVHLCAGAPAFALARQGRAPLRELLALVHDRLDAAVERLGTGATAPGTALRAHVLDSPRLPVKAMVTAGTLLSKQRSGAQDINKHYTTGPNYLLQGA
ncbi:IucA/IucC family protein [Streptomyces sp. NPDC002490]|uniref:IucA/IucC family protein n=1 Tax=Streptomyces sp. NPDC002490 TaxID=3154416 RepID=UPI0033263A81